ncbi:MAG: hypothetical protein JNL58_11010 [Planctomyces sp.]|nr:hypothetical protein [Planctomyces sp.]
MPNVKYPSKLIPTDYWPPEGQRHYFQTGERWETVAAKWGVDVKTLFFHNFRTIQPEEVNWYLTNLIGCKYSSDGLNYAFKTGEGFGYVVVPSKSVHFDPEVIEVSKSEVDRLKPLIAKTPGVIGQRMRCLLEKAILAGSPGDEKWWYYNSQATLIYMNVYTTNQQRRWMSLPTQGRLPFDGTAGAAFGEWRIYPFRKLKIECIGGCSDSELTRKLEDIESDFHNSFANVANGAGSAKASGPLVEEFVRHVYQLSQSRHSLYSCGGLGEKSLFSGFA